MCLTSKGFYVIVARDGSLHRAARREPGDRSGARDDTAAALARRSARGGRRRFCWRARPGPARGWWPACSTAPARARHGAFVPLNCAAIPETLLESELFGYERGAFTDARRAKPGLFQTAHQGTHLPGRGRAAAGAAPGEAADRHRGARGAAPGRHARPSRPTRGSSAPPTPICRAAIRERRFREDLYHRLAVLTLRLPPLRERGRDVILLAEHLLVRVCADYGLPLEDPVRRGPGAAAGAPVARATSASSATCWSGSRC